MNRSWFGPLIAVMLTAGASTAAPPCDDRPAVEAVEAAKGLHRAAELHFGEGRHDEAIDAWKLAYELDCEAHRLLIDIGNAEARAGRFEDAVDAYESYLERAGDRDLPQAAERLAELRGEAAEGVTPTPREPTVPLTALVLAGVGGAIAVAGAVSLGVGIEAEARANDACPDLAACPAATVDDHRRAIVLEQVGGGLVAVGLATALGSLVYLALDEAPVEASLGLGTARLRVRF